MKLGLSEQEQYERDHRAEVCQAIRKGKRHKSESRFIDVCRYVIENGCSRFKGLAIDSFSASAFIQIYDKLSEKHQSHLGSIADANPIRGMDIVWKLIQKHGK